MFRDSSTSAAESTGRHHRESDDWCPGCCAVRNAARHSEDVSPLLGGKVSRDEGAALLACLDDNHAAAHAANDAVPGRKIACPQVQCPARTR